MVNSFSDSDIELSLQALVRPPSIVDEDLSLPPTDGHQYLRRVIDEAKLCEEFRETSIYVQPQKYSQFINLNEEKKECDKNLLPRKSWQISAIKDFSQLRVDINSLKKKCLCSQLKAIRRSLPSTDLSDDWLKIVHNGGPSTKYCIAMSQVEIMNLLSFFNDWLSDGGLVSITIGCRWIYCLLACLDNGHAPNIYFCLRQITRYLINFRTQMKDPFPDETPQINLIICIIGHYFSQMDLADLQESSS